MTVKQLLESSAEAPVKKGNRWRVIVARPGKGSSGTYSEELFRRDAHKIVAAGAQSFINHDSDRNPKDMIGFYPEAAYFDEEEKAVVAELEVFSHWKEFVEEVGPHCGISLYAMGDADEEGNVTEIHENRLNGADLVSRPGLIGSGLANKLYESAVAGKDTERNEMDEKVLEALNALTTQISALVADKEAKAEQAAQVEADANAVATAVEAYDAAVKAVDEADLLAPQRESLLESAKRGEDITQAIESAKAVKVAAMEALKLSEDIIEDTQGRNFGAPKVESATDLGKVFG